MKKAARRLLLIYVCIGIVAAGVTGWSLYWNRLEFRKEQVRSAFEKSLPMSLKKWSNIDVYHVTSGAVRLSDDSIVLKKAPIKVSVTNNYGARDYMVPYEKYSHNIGWCPEELSVMHSYLLYESPLNADSLNLFWQEQLAEKGFSGTTVVRISVADWQERESYTYSADSLYLSKADSLSIYYLGYRCEVGVTGYFYTPWWMVFSWKNWFGLAALMVSCILLFFVRSYVYRIYCFLFVKEKRIVEVREVRVIVKEEVPVIGSRESGSHIYQLEEGVYFDSDSLLLKGKDTVVKLPSSLAILLQGFLDAKNYRLYNREIQHLLWPDDNDFSNKMYQSISRLREYLSKVSVCTVEGERFSYRLIIPHSIDKNPIRDCS